MSYIPPIGNNVVIEFNDSLPILDGSYIEIIFGAGSISADSLTFTGTLDAGASVDSSFELFTCNITALEVGAVVFGTLETFTADLEAGASLQGSLEAFSHTATAPVIYGDISVFTGTSSGTFERPNVFFVFQNKVSLTRMLSSELKQLDAALIGMSDESPRIYVYYTSPVNIYPIVDQTIIYPDDLTSGQTGWYPLDTVFPKDSVYGLMKSYEEQYTRNVILGTSIYGTEYSNTSPSSAEIEVHFDLDSYPDLYLVRQVIFGTNYDGTEFRAIIVTAFGVYKVLNTTISSFLPFPNGEYLREKCKLFIKTNLASGDDYLNIYVYFLALEGNACKYSYYDDEFYPLYFAQSGLYSVTGAIYYWIQEVPYLTDLEHHDIYYVGENEYTATNKLYFFDTRTEIGYVVRNFSASDHPWMVGIKFDGIGSYWNGYIRCKRLEGLDFKFYQVSLYDNLHTHTGVTLYTDYSFRIQTQYTLNDNRPSEMMFYAYEESFYSYNDTDTTKSILYPVDNSLGYPYLPVHQQISSLVPVVESAYYYHGAYGIPYALETKLGTFMLASQALNEVHHGFVKRL